MTLFRKEAESQQNIDDSDDAYGADTDKEDDEEEEDAYEAETDIDEDNLAGISVRHFINISQLKPEISLS